MTERTMIGLACPHGNVPGRLFDWLRRILPAQIGEDLVVVQVDGESEVAYANNLLAAKFLASPFDKLWLLAADLVPYPGTHTILEAAADVAVGVSYVEQEDPDDPTGYVAGPNIVRFRDPADLWSWEQLHWSDVGVEPIQRVGGGMHCAVIRKHVFGLPGMQLALGAWFRTLRDESGRRTMSDDVDFCHRALVAGASVTAYPGALSGHLKLVDIGGVWRSALARGRSAAFSEV